MSPSDSESACVYARRHFETAADLSTRRLAQHSRWQGPLPECRRPARSTEPRCDPACQVSYEILEPSSSILDFRFSIGNNLLSIKNRKSKIESVNQRPGNFHIQLAPPLRIAVERQEFCVEDIAHPDANECRPDANVKVSTPVRKGSEKCSAPVSRVDELSHIILVFGSAQSTLILQRRACPQIEVAVEELPLAIEIADAIECREPVLSCWIDCAEQRIVDGKMQ